MHLKKHLGACISRSIYRPSAHCRQLPCESVSHETLVQPAQPRARCKAVHELIAFGQCGRCTSVEEKSPDILSPAGNMIGVCNASLNYVVFAGLHFRCMMQLAILGAQQCRCRVLFFFLHRDHTQTEQSSLQNCNVNSRNMAIFFWLFPAPDFLSSLVSHWHCRWKASNFLWESKPQAILCLFSL